MARIFAPHTIIRMGIALVLAGVLAACGSAPPTSGTVTQQPIVTAPTTAPTIAPTVAPTIVPTATPTVAPTVVPTAEPTPEPRSQVFNSARLPIAIEYPTGWTVVDFGEREAASYVGLPERSMEITAPDAEARLIVRYYDYKGPGSGDTTGAYMAIQFNESIERTTVSETSDDNGNITAEWTYIDTGTEQPVHALVRFIHNEGSPYTYALLFQAPEERFAELAPIGQAMIETFQER